MSKKSELEKEGLIKIIAISSHAAQLITGNVRGHIHGEKAGVTLTFDEDGDGVWVRGKQTNKLIPFSNIQGLDVQEMGQEAPVTATK